MISVLQNMYKRIKNNETRENGEIKNANSVVTFNYYGRVNYTPCVSPFDIKLETYLRAAKVPYEVSRRLPSSYRTTRELDR